jgi:thiamine-phosphate pyrophosphorylase
MKNDPERVICPVAEELAEVCSRRDVLFIVNDHPHIARLAGADGVHLGEEDLQISQARRIIRDDMIVGVSTHSYEQAMDASRFDPDYIAIGPIFCTDTKGVGSQQGIGVEIISKIKTDIDIPLVAIGGITADNASQAVAAGADAVAVISALYRDKKIDRNCREIVKSLGSRVK